MTAITEKLYPNRVPREPFGLKGKRSINRITFNHPPANPQETLYLTIPKLAENVAIAPGSIKLLFDLHVEGHANNTVGNNLGGNLFKRLKVTFGGETLQDCQGYELLKTYEDLYPAPKEERADRLNQGI